SIGGTNEALRLQPALIRSGNIEILPCYMPCLRLRTSLLAAFRVASDGIASILWDWQSCGLVWLPSRSIGRSRQNAPPRRKMRSIRVRPEVGRRECWLPTTYSSQSSPNNSAGCEARIVPLPQRMSSAGQNLSHPQQIRSGCLGWSGSLGVFACSWYIGHFQSSVVRRTSCATSSNQQDLQCDAAGAIFLQISPGPRLEPADTGRTDHSPARRRYTHRPVRATHRRYGCIRT